MADVTDKDVKDFIDEVKKYRTGAAWWAEVRGQQFEHEEARQAADFDDLMTTYGLDESEWRTLISENEVKDKVGIRLWLAEKMPLEDLGVVLLSELDRRIIAITKDRCDVNKGKIIL